MALIGHVPNSVRYNHNIENASLAELREWFSLFVTAYSAAITSPTTNISVLYSNNLHMMATQRATLVPWMKEELERLVAWMEENPEDLRGRQAGGIRM